jgi:hypothetical protein
MESDLGVGRAAFRNGHVGRGLVDTRLHLFTALSRLKHGFDSRRERQGNQILSRKKRQLKNPDGKKME